MTTTHRPAPHRKPLVLGLSAALALALGAPAGAGAPVPQPQAVARPLAGLGILDNAPRHKWRDGMRAQRSPAATIAVSNCNDAGPGSLRAAIAAAGEGDTVDMSGLGCSTISLSTGEIAVPQKDLVIVGPGPNALTIDAQGASRAFSMTSKYSSSDPYHDIYLAGFTIANGKETGGGCISSAGDLTLYDMALRNCEARATGTDSTSGGAVASIGNVFLVNSIVSGNRAIAEDGRASGGGIFTFKYASSYASTFVDNHARAGGNAAGGALVMSRGRLDLSRLQGNEARSTAGVAMGGAAFVPGEETTLRGGPSSNVIASFSQILDNRAIALAGNAYGGAFHAGDTTASNTKVGLAGLFASTMSGNRAEATCGATPCIAAGGGASALGVAVSYYSTVAGNSATVSGTTSGLAFGGGLALVAGTPPPVGVLLTANSTLSGNQASAENGFGVGGGAANTLAATEILFSTLADNSASSVGGGLLTADTGQLTLMVNSIVANNQAGSGGEDVGSFLAVTVTGNNNLVSTAPGTVTLPADTLVADPLLAPLANNGGPTRTHALCPGSPAIDAGGPARLDAPAWSEGRGGPGSDQRLDPYVRIFGTVADIGAYEWQQPDPERIFWDGFDPDPCG